MVRKMDGVKGEGGGDAVKEVLRTLIGGFFFIARTAFEMKSASYHVFRIYLMGSTEVAIKRPPNPPI